MRIFSLGVLTLTLSLAVGMASLQSAHAKSTAHKAVKKALSSTATYSAAGADPIVQKNADGTVDVYDAPSGDSGGGGSVAAAPATPRVIYHRHPAGTTRYSDGTVVTRNPDGSVDVSDSDSDHPQIQWDRAPSSSSSGHSTARHKSAHSTAKKHH